MKKFIKSFHYVFLTSSSYILLFMTLSYFFETSKIPVYTIIFYAFFYLVTFLSYRHKTFKMDGRFHVFLILASAVLFNYLYKLIDISFNPMTYVYFIQIIMYFSLLQMLVMFAKPIWQYLLTIQVFIVFILIIVLVIIHGLEANLLLFGVGLFKLIPFSISYTISQTRKADYRNVFYVIIFLPLILMNNLLSIIIKPISYLSIREKIKIQA